MLALIDNYDSFTYNLVQYADGLTRIRVFRNDQVSLDELIALKPDHLVVSPGPGEPIKDGGLSGGSQTLHRKDPRAGRLSRAPVSRRRLRRQSGPGGTFDARQDIVRQPQWSGYFQGYPSPFEGMRYHSLIVHEPVPAELEVLATTSEGEIMALKHREHPTYGVQFHRVHSDRTRQEIAEKLFRPEACSRCRRRTSHAQTLYCQSHQPHRPQRRGSRKR